MPRHNPAIPAVVWIAWVAFLLRGAFYSTAMPLWEGYDEWSHYAFVQYVRVHHSRPSSQSAPSAEIADSFALVPLPRMLRHFEPPAMIHDQYWRLPPVERSRREATFRTIDLTNAYRVGSVERIYEAMQPPLYYWLFSAPDWLIRGLHLAQRVVIL